MAEVNLIRFQDVDKGAYVPVGRLLRRVRDLRGISQQEAAERIGITGSTLSAIEAGRRPIRSVLMSIRLADGLHVPRLQLIEWVIREVEQYNPELRRQN